MPDRSACSPGSDRAATDSVDQVLLDRLVALWRQRPCAAPATLAIYLDPDGRLGVSGRKVKAWLALPEVKARLTAPDAA